MSDANDQPASPPASTQERPAEAIHFVRLALDAALRDPALAPDGHVDAAAICRVFIELVIDEFRSRAEPVLREWDLVRSEQVGAVVRRLIEIGVVKLRVADAAQDFADLFDLDRPQADWLLQW
jgi:uncharacterized repeat protein (TIGR04138 family)